MKQKQLISTPTPETIGLTDLDWKYARWNGPGQYDWIVNTLQHGRGLKPIAMIPSQPYSEANARLIAQAPALVDTLRACLDAFDKIGHGLTLQDCEWVAPLMEQPYDKARALLVQIEEGRP